MLERFRLRQAMNPGPHPEPAGAEPFPGSGEADDRVTKPTAGRFAARPRASRR